METDANKIELNNMNEDDANKPKRKPKIDPEGKNYNCEVCGKVYSSKPAVTQHLKSKHPESQSGIKRGRGRPRKDEGQVVNQIGNRENFMKTFFDKSSRLKGLDSYSIEEEIASIYTSLLTDFKAIFKESPDETNDFPLIKLQSKDSDIVDVKTYDQAIVKYLNFVGSKSSKSFFHFACKFNILFREYINNSKSSNELLVHPFSEHNSAENVPESCNDFVVNFLEANSFFGLDMIEVIDEIQHFCAWLYDSGYTMSMLTLVST